MLFEFESRSVIAMLVDKVTELLQSFLNITASESERMRALRLLTLHMLKGHAPDFFAFHSLDRELQKALAACEGFRPAFPLGLDSDTALARVDICYVLHCHHRSYALAERVELEAYLDYTKGSGDLIYAWLCGELVYRCGLDLRLKLPVRPYRDVSRLHDLYWVTHQFLLATEYLHRPLPRLGWDSRVNDLIESVQWLVSERLADLGAEVALCLQLAGRHKECQPILDFLHECSKDGLVIDSLLEPEPHNYAHTTAAALLATVRA